MMFAKAIKAIEISKFGDANVLIQKKRTLKSIKANEVLIKIACAGLSGPDILQRKGFYKPTKENATFPGLEVSGVIAAKGKNVKNHKIGDEVIALCNGGGYAEFVNVPASQTLPKPKSWSFVEAATIPETFFTIIQTLIMRAKLKKNMFVLIHGASGGLGASAIQIAKFYGARPIALVSSEQKSQYVKNLGAEFIINYQKHDFVEKVLEITNGHGADRIIDIIGGEVFSKNIKVAAKGATILLLAFLGGAKSEINLSPILLKGLNIFGSTLGPQDTKTKAQIARLADKDLFQAISNKTIKPPRIITFDLKCADLAHQAFENKNHHGKIVLVTDFGKTIS